VVGVALLDAITVPFPIGPEEALAAGIAAVVPLATLDDARKPLQRPLLQEVFAHWESVLHAALKFPQRAMIIMLLAQHSASFAHWLGFTCGLHGAPRGRDPAGATTVDDGAGCGPWAGVLVMVADVEEAAAEEVAIKPLQRPPSQVLNAHCSLLVHEAWKLPQTVCSMELTA